jgi:glycosyltransferase involved in cell wall biosynthesis
MLTVITPTTGKDSLYNAIESLKAQTSPVPIRHIILWDNKREGDFLFPNDVRRTASYPLELEREEGNYSSNCIVIKDHFIQGKAAGSALRGIGLMAANTDYVCFMDDDVMWDSGHVEAIMKAIEGKEWAFSKRRIWTTADGGYECLGVDDFESIGEDSKISYKMVDNNCMLFKRKYGVSAACLYRQTTNYNDDRLMYNFLMKYAGDPGKTNEATINQVCPEKLIGFFRRGCTKEEDAN